MSSLNESDIKSVDALVDFASGRGYVLDFSDRDMTHFFGVMGIDIDAAEYAVDGVSKGKRLRAFLRSAENLTAAHVLQALWDHRATFLLSTGQRDPVVNAEARFLALMAKLGGFTPADIAPPAPGQVVRDELLGPVDTYLSQRMVAARVTMLR